MDSDSTQQRGTKRVRVATYLSEKYPSKSVSNRSFYRNSFPPASKSEISNHVLNTDARKLKRARRELFNKINEGIVGLPLSSDDESYDDESDSDSTSRAQEARIWRSYSAIGANEVNVELEDNISTFSSNECQADSEKDEDSAQGQAETSRWGSDVEESEDDPIYDSDDIDFKIKTLVAALKNNIPPQGGNEEDTIMEYSSDEDDWDADDEKEWHSMSYIAQEHIEEADLGEVELDDIAQAELESQEYDSDDEDDSFIDPRLTQDPSWSFLDGENNNF
jgi:hypothetical protein